MLSPKERQPSLSPYEAFAQEELILRDYLAADRTALANERTFMSYLRTALAFVIGGASAIHFLGGVEVEVAGAALIVAGAVTFTVGMWRYLLYRRRIAGVLAEMPPPAPR